MDRKNLVEKEGLSGVGGVCGILIGDVDHVGDAMGDPISEAYVKLVGLDTSFTDFFLLNCLVGIVIIGLHAID